MIDNRGVVATSAVYALAHLGLARAETQAGDPRAAREAYDRFFSVWKDADPELPALAAARREYAALAGS